MTKTKTQKLYGWISKNIIDLSNEQSIDEDMLMTYSIYLKITAIKALISSCRTYSDAISQEIVLKKIISSNIEVDGITQLSIDPFLIIFEEIFVRKAKDQLTWIKPWEQLCCTILDEAKDRLLAYNEIIFLINDSLEFNAERALVTEFLMYKSYATFEFLKFA